MKIVYLHQYFNLPTASGSTRSYEMARRLVERGHEVHMVTTERDTGPRRRGWQTSTVAGIRVHSIHVPYRNAMTYAQRIRAFLHFALASSRRARQLKPDIVFATSTPLTVAIPARLARLFRNTPQVFEVRDLWPTVPIAMGALRSRPLRLAARWLERFAYRSSAHVVALSPEMKEGVVAAGYPASQVTVIPNSSDIELFDIADQEGQRFRHEQQWLADEPLLVYCGTLGLANNVEFVIDLAAESLAQEKHWQFLIAGSGAREAALRAYAEERGVAGVNLRILPAMPKTEVAKAYSAADVVLVTFADVPELTACSPNKLFDALAASRPVAMNYGGWMAEVLHESGAGVQLERYDLSSAVAALDRLLKDRDAWRKASEAAGALARNVYSRDLHAAELASVLESVAHAPDRN